VQLQGLSGRSGLSPNPRWDARIYPESLAVDCVLMATGSNYSLRLPACFNSALG